MIKLEAGKYYKTRDGRKAFVGFLVKSVGVHCGEWIGEVSGEVEGWNGIGICMSFGAASKSNADLIEEWKEPEVFEFDGYISSFDDSTLTMIHNVDNVSFPHGMVRVKITKKVK